MNCAIERCIPYCLVLDAPRPSRPGFRRLRRLQRRSQSRRFALHHHHRVHSHHVGIIPHDGTGGLTLSIPCVRHSTVYRCHPLLINSRAYSAHEFSSLSNRVQSGASIPLDIQIETLAAVFLACSGFVLGSQPLKPISWSTWAGKIERDGAPNPFLSLENRVGFMDIRVSSCPCQAV